MISSLIVGSWLTAGCGARDALPVEPPLAQAPEEDAGAPDATPDAAPEPPSCSADGLPCKSPVECCSGVCSDKGCGVSTCTPDGAACQRDGQCCTGRCADGRCGGACLPEGAGCSAASECCAMICENGACGGGCAPRGAPCMTDAECCERSCVNGACGGGCTPDGGRCRFDAQCCGGACSRGVCAGSCTPDGGRCTTSADCCTGRCENGTCGAAPTCPSNGTQCNDCIAKSCCVELQQCIGDPGCTRDVTCFLDCIGQGRNPAVCGFQCVHAPATLQLLVCIGTSCRTDCF